MSYDRLGRLGGTTDRSGQGRSAKYDAIGRVLTQTDALGKTTSYVYDTAERSMVVTTPEGVEVKTVFAGDGQICSVTDGNKNTTKYFYDADGNFTRAECTLDGKTVVREKRSYDAADRLKDTTDANGVVVSYSYDAAGRVWTRTVDPTESAGPTALALRTEYEYDGPSVAAEAPCVFR